MAYARTVAALTVKAVSSVSVHRASKSAEKESRAKTKDKKFAFRDSSEVGILLKPLSHFIHIHVII